MDGGSDEERRSPDGDRGKARSGGGRSSRRRLTAPPARVEDRRERDGDKKGGGDRHSERRGDSSRSRERGSTSAHQSERDRDRAQGQRHTADRPRRDHREREGEEASGRLSRRSRSISDRGPELGSALGGDDDGEPEAGGGGGAGGGRDARQHRAQSVFNRNRVEAPMSMEGWMGWLSDGVLFKRWKRYYFHLEYPFLNFYHEELPEGSKERAAVKPKGKISMRGSCLLNANLAGDKKHTERADTRFRVKGNGKEWVLEAESPIRKAAWADALRTHIEYANPAKSPNGVNYNCRANDDEDTPMCLNISLKHLTLVNLKTGKTSWTRPYWQLRTMQRPPTQPSELYLDFHAYGGTTKLAFTNVTAQVVGACVAGIVGTHAEWKGIFPAEW